MLRFVVPLAFVCLLSPAWGQAPEPSPEQAPAPTLELRAPEGWVAVPSSGELRFAEFRPEGEETGPELIVFHFDGHGDVDVVVGRWLSRMELPDGRPAIDHAPTTRWARGDWVLHVVDVRGTRLPSEGHSRDPTPHPRHESWRLMAAVLECPSGPYFFRLEGPQDALESLAEGFYALTFGARGER
jgi:hypothetical protein